MKNTIIAPSILSADFLHLEDELRKCEDAGAEWIHFDVMDGSFVPNISFGLPVLECVSKATELVKDVHLMIDHPEKYVKRFCDAGADYVTFHLEACESEKDVIKCIDMIHDEGKKAGISIKPNTRVQDVEKYLPLVDLLLVMSVEPGFGGQAFMPNAGYKILQLKEYRDAHPDHFFYIEVDGGINDKTGPICVFYGVDVLVAGSYLFKADDMKEKVQLLKNNG